MKAFNPQMSKTGTFFPSKVANLTAPTTCVHDIGFPQCHKKHKFSSASLKHRYSHNDTVSVKDCRLVHCSALSNVSLFVISLFELKLDFYSIHYHVNTKRSALSSC